MKLWTSIVLTIWVLVMGGSFLAVAAQTRSPVQSAERPAAAVSAQAGGATQPALPAAPATQLSGTLAVAKGEFYELQELKIREDLKDDLAKWAGGWLILLTGIFAPIAYFGAHTSIGALFREKLDVAMQAAAGAQATTELSKDALRELRKNIADYGDQVEAAGQLVADVERRFVELRSRIDAEGERSIASAELKFESIEKKVEVLREVVARLEASAEQSASSTQNTEQAIGQIRTAAAKEESTFAKNGQIKVVLIPYGDGVTAEQAERISHALTEQGYRLAKSPWGYSTPDRAKAIKFAYQESIEGKAQEVLQQIKSILTGEVSEADIRVVKSLNPLRNSDAQIAVFFE